MVPASARAEQAAGMRCSGYAAGQARGIGDALLGGVPSRLGQVSATQTGATSPRVSPLIAVDCLAWMSRHDLGRMGAHRMAPAVIAGPVDFFGSTALAVARTPLDHKWASVAAGLPREGAWRALVENGRSLPPSGQVDAVNRWVNGRLRFVDDLGASGQVDQWSPAARTLDRGTGDCEDYAIAKMRLLEAMGFDRRSLFLVIARDLVRRADHAVLVARIGDDAVVLDNMTSRLVQAMDASDYRPIITFGSEGRWTHGYRVAGAGQPAPRLLASLH
ncbi:transglutaminase-like cysteine peptidase [Sphingobium sp. H39-3-25]|uniref:transglutaminase-like cysteine peptidase n=1 Tax=Sphingobium arseniciresistens TaxID=3030834 RepID=UPI0023B8C8D5|nr:transglutaminase-like cysteine peptidase [Sphingobium arseniciresistens]